MNTSGSALTAVVVDSDATVAGSPQAAPITGPAGAALTFTLTHAAATGPHTITVELLDGLTLESSDTATGVSATGQPGTGTGGGD